jgi:hypothetical protein
MTRARRASNALTPFVILRHIPKTSTTPHPFTFPACLHVSLHDWIARLPIYNHGGDTPAHLPLPLSSTAGS